MITNKRNIKERGHVQASVRRKSKSCFGQGYGIVGGFLFLMFSFLFTGCYHKKTPSSFSIPDSIQEAQISRHLSIGNDSILRQKSNRDVDWSGMRSKIDSLDFRVKHHYSQGFNFIVTADSLMLLRQQPEEAVNGMKIDSFAVKNGKEVVVADKAEMPEVAPEISDTEWAELRRKSRRKALIVGCGLGAILMTLGFFAGRAVQAEKEPNASAVVVLDSDFSYLGISAGMERM